MSHKERKFRILVQEKQGGGYTLTLDEGGHTIPEDVPIVFDKPRDGMKKTDYYQLKFTIENGPNCDLEFLNDLDDVMWVHNDPAICPNTRCHMKNTFWTNNVNPKNLKLINMDLKQETLRFTINLVERGTTAPYIPLDPIVTNGNQGDPDAPLVEYSASSMVVGAATGALVAVGSIVSVTGMIEREALVYGIAGGMVGLLVGLMLGRR